MNSPALPPSAVQRLEALQPLLSEPKKGKLLSQLIMLNLFFLLCRPQNNAPVIAWLFIPVLVSIAPFFATLFRMPQLWRLGAVTRAMLAMIVLGAAWIIPARNNFWAAQTVRDVAQQDFCFLFPVMLFCSTGKRLRRLAFWTTLCGVYLGIYAIIHGGFGPGGFLGDENDLCLQLDALLGIPLLLILTPRSFGNRLLLISSVLVIMAGIVITWSRGGFVGMLLVLGYMYWRAPRKIAAAFVGTMIVLCGLAFVPQSYWDEMKTITHSDEGTAKGRIDIWKIGLRVWLDPKHFLFGTGMQNTPRHLADYEPDENKLPSGKSTGGRAVHSMYVQLVGDLGLAGLSIFLICVLGTLRGNARLIRIARNERWKLIRAERLVGSTMRQPSPDEAAAATAMKSIFRELDYTSTLLMGINASFFGALAAGTFVSAVYYPTIWCLVAFGMAGRNYMRELLQRLEGIRETPA